MKYFMINKCIVVLRLIWVQCNVLLFLKCNVYLLGFGNAEINFHIILLYSEWKVKNVYTLWRRYEDRCLLGCDAVYNGRDGRKY